MSNYILYSTKVFRINCFDCLQRMFRMAVLPRESPTITGTKLGPYSIGEEFVANCTSFRSKPAAELTWSIADKQVTRVTSVWLTGLLWHEPTLTYRCWTKTWSDTTSFLIRMGWTRPWRAYASACAAITSTRAKCSWRARPASAKSASTRVRRPTSPIRTRPTILNSDLSRVGPYLPPVSH